SIENMFIIINAVPAITTQLNVKKRIAEGLEKVGYTMTKILISWFLVLMIFSVTNINSIQEFCIFTSIAMIIDFMLQMSFFIAVLSIDLERLALEISNLYNNRISNPDDNINKKSIQHSKTTNYGRRIGILLVVLILLIAVTNIHHANMNLPYIKSSLNSLISDFIVPPTNTYTNTTFWETSIDKTANEFWGVINPDKKNQFVEIRPTRYLTLSYDIESDDLSRSLNDVKNWKLIIRIYIKTFVWFLKVIIFPIISIIFAMSILANFSSADIEIRITRLFENSNNDENKNTLSTRSSAFCVNSAQVITLRGRHSADIDLLCANFNGIIISSATDRHITSWNGKQGIPLRKLERYMRRCDTCKCDSTGGLKNCISWPVRA
ncbi:5543_t:CDS:2, partial [Scutellospora calospora]